MNQQKFNQLNFFEKIEKLDAYINSFKDLSNPVLKDLKNMKTVLENINFKQYKIDPKKSYFKIENDDFEFNLVHSDNSDYSILFRYAGMENEFWIGYDKYFDFSCFGGSSTKDIANFLILQLNNRKKLAYRGKYLLKDSLIDETGRTVKKGCYNRPTLYLSLYYFKKAIGKLPPQKTKIISWK